MSRSMNRFRAQTSSYVIDSQPIEGHQCRFEFHFMVPHHVNGMVDVTIAISSCDTVLIVL